jgi:hypothetical protein
VAALSSRYFLDSGFEVSRGIEVVERRTSSMWGLTAPLLLVKKKFIDDQGRTDEAESADF